MNDEFVCDVVRQLKTILLPAEDLRQTSRPDQALIRALVPILELFRARLGPAARLYHAPATGGDPAEWAACKADQNVSIGGRDNTFDLFLTDVEPRAEGPGRPTATALAIETEYARGCNGRDGCAIYGSVVQQGIGQTLIAAMRHAYAVCLVVCDHPLPKRSKDDKLDRLAEHLWQKQPGRGRVALIVRSSGSPRHPGTQPRPHQSEAKEKGAEP